MLQICRIKKYVTKNDKRKGKVMKKNYENPNFEIIQLDKEDIVTKSGSTGMGFDQQAPAGPGGTTPW